MNFKNLFGLRFCITDYNEVTEYIIDNAKKNDNKVALGVSALAVHGLIEAHSNTVLRSLVNKIDLVIPDGQPVRWALNYFHNTNLKDRVYGPNLTIRLLEEAAKNGLPVFFYGSTQETLLRLIDKLPKRFHGLDIAGVQADRFRDSTVEEMQSDVKKILLSGARLVFVGRGCPRQEKWVALHKEHLNMPLIAVGAAFDFLAENISQAPAWMQQNGLEWFYRLLREPRRLWRRYLFTNSLFLALFFVNALKKLLRI
jgi:exopolysaccharide biosynthesis WecB/TagA/CpsF family protein